jgi:hypothetical protein
VKLNTHIYLVPTLRISGTRTPQTYAFLIHKVMVKVKGKGHPITGLEDPQED